MPIRFACADCGVRVKTPDGSEGKKMRCPRCGHLQLVPMRPENRERFLADERAYLDEWDMTEDQKQGVLDRDLNRLISLGGNIYYLAKIGATDGMNFAEIVASMTGATADEHVAMMVAGGRSPDGNRYLHEWQDRA